MLLTHRSILFVIVTLTTPFLGGCGGAGGPERVVVTGNVSYKGQPVQSGEILFRPVQTSPGPSTTAEIIDGKYKADSHGGVAVGTHKIQILGYRLGKSPANAGARPKPGVKEDSIREQYIPQHYNTNTSIEFSIPSGSGKITKDFDLAN